jgi:hypothetical protein
MKKIEYIRLTKKLLESTVSLEKRNRTLGSFRYRLMYRVKDDKDILLALLDNRVPRWIWLDKNGSELSLEEVVSVSPKVAFDLNVLTTIDQETYKIKHKTYTNH